MFNSGNVPSVADIAAVTGANCRNNDGGWGNDWWAVIIILALFGGWGGRGGLFGNAGSGSGCGCSTPATCSELQAGFNNQAVTNKLNGLENGLCSLGYDQLAQMNGITNTIQQGNFALQQTLNNNAIAQIQDTNAVSRQLADCCCENRAAIKDVQYTAAMNNSALLQAINAQTNAIVQNDNANYRALHDELVSYQMQQKDDVIAELRSQVQALNLGVSQRNQNDYLIDRLQPCAKPAYFVPNPNCCYTPQQYAQFAGAACGGCC